MLIIPIKVMGRVIFERIRDRIGTTWGCMTHTYTLGIILDRIVKINQFRERL